MFEEVPRERRGLARISARRYVLGHFVVGGGVLLTTLGGSVAAVATVITASTIGITPVGPSRTHHRAAPAATTASSHPGVAVTTASATTSASTHHSSGSLSHDPGTTPPKQVPTSRLVTPPAASSRAGASSGSSGGTSGVGPATPATSGPGTPSASGSGPAGNAVVYVTGYDSGAVVFQYASVQRGAGAGGSDLYTVTAPATYRAPMATGISIVSGDQICPPAGNSCTPDQLVKAAPSGFFADVGIDASGSLRSVIERDNTSSFSANRAPSTPTASDTAAPASSSS